jgi:hypothetical protein
VVEPVPGAENGDCLLELLADVVETIRFLRCVTEALGPKWHVTKVDYRLRKPVCAPANLAYTARVTHIEGDIMTLELAEEHPSGELGFEGTVRVSTGPYCSTSGCSSTRFTTTTARPGSSPPATRTATVAR